MVKYKYFLILLFLTILIPSSFSVVKIKEESLVNSTPITLVDNAFGLIPCDNNNGLLYNTTKNSWECRFITGGNITGSFVRISGDTMTGDLNLTNMTFSNLVAETSRTNGMYVNGTDVIFGYIGDLV